MYKVVQDLTVKVNGTIKTFYIGSIVNLPEKSAQMFIQQGKIESVITEPEQQTSVQESKKKSSRHCEPTQPNWKLNKRIGLPDMNPNKYKCLQCSAIAGRYCLAQDLNGKWLWGWMCLKCCPYNDPKRN